MQVKINHGHAEAQDAQNVRVKTVTSNFVIEEIDGRLRITKTSGVRVEILPVSSKVIELQ